MSGEVPMAKPLKKRKKTASQSQSDATVSQAEKVSDISGGTAATNGAPGPEDAAVAPRSTETVAEHQAAGSSYKKRLKKDKRAAAAAAASAAVNAAAASEPSPIPSPTTLGDSITTGMEAVQATANGDAASDKDAKKAAKKARKAAAAATALAVAGSNEPTSQGASETKLSKKQRKRLAASDTEATPETGAEVKAVKPKAKKAKMTELLVQTNNESSRKLAAVGDAALARSSKPIVRSTYSEHAATAAQSKSDVASLRESRATTIIGTNLKPIREFVNSGFGPKLLQSCSGFATPSPIQSECWAPACSGEDVVGIAATGSGKTLAFGLPALAHCGAQIAAGVADGRTPSVLVIAPTRELAVQISEVLENAGKPVGLTALCVYGGVPKHPQAKTLRAGVNVLVATPGRLEDLMNDNAARLHQVTFLVLDEADRMLDLGFEPHIRAIANKTRADRQTLMFSATWPPAIQRLASEFLSTPVRVTIGSADLSASHSVSQVIEVIDPRARDKRLQQLLQQYHDPKRTNRIIVFVLYKKEAARVEGMLKRAGWKAVAVHGDATQAARTAAVDSFKAGTVGLLIATDVAARGLDIPDVEVVINYSFPLTTEDYVHRIGRTGRAGKTGAAHTFFSGESDKPRAGELINVLREAGQPVPEELLAFGTTVKKKESKLYGAHFKDVDFSQKATKMTFDDSDDE